MKSFLRIINVVSLLGSIVWLLLSNLNVSIADYYHFSEKTLLEKVVFASTGNPDADFCRRRNEGIR